MSILSSSVRRKNAQLSSADASRFLRQMYFGVKPAEITEVIGRRPKDVIEEQMAIEPQQSIYTMSKDRGPAGFPATWDIYYNARLGAAEYKLYIHPDKFRNRIAYSLLDYFVTSWAISDNYISRESMSNYLDILYNNAFGNFRTLLEQVTRSIEMSLFLTHFRNQKADPISGRQPDENYAREVMQLFTIGLWELKDDGTRKKSGELDPTDARYVASGTDDVPTYGQEDITNIARVFTGMCLRNKNNVLGFNNITQSSAFSENAGQAAAGTPLYFWATPLEFDNNYHEMSLSKVALQGRINIPVGTNGDTSLDMALNALVNHPCTPPFFVSRMIRLLITSNPSSAYISRIVSVFKDDGTGIRGNLGAVFKAMFLDQEARAPSEKNLLSKCPDIYQHWAGTVMGSYGGLPNSTDGALTAGGTGSYPGNTGSSYNRLGWWEHYQNSCYNRAGSVFGRFPAVYSPPNSAVYLAGKAAPEMFHYEEGGVDSLFEKYGGAWEAVRNNTMIAQDYTDLTTNPVLVVNRLSLLITSNTAPQSYIDTLTAYVRSSSQFTQDDGQKRQTYSDLFWLLWLSPWGLIRT